MAPLTPRQTEVLAFLREFQDREGLSASIPDITAHFGFAPHRAAAKLVEQLEAKGAIARQPGSRRSIRILQSAGPRPNQLPLLGRIAAGRPITSGEHVAEYLDISPSLFSPRPDFLFRVTGDSMINEGIYDDDLVGVRSQGDVRNGQIVAALIIDPKTDDPELTLKRYRRKGSVVSLLSENDDQEQYAPMTFDVRKDLIQIVGLYCGLVRTQPR